MEVTLRPQDSDVTVLSLFEKWEESAPGQLAVVHDSAEFTYADLKSRADGIAHALHAAGVRRGARVGMRLQHSADAIASMLAAFQLGAAFVPLDPDFPQERIAFMLEDSEIETILVDDDWQPPSSATAKLLSVSDIEAVQTQNGEFAEDFAAPPFDTCAQPDDLAYIMYTSGSTGKPKGVLIDHRALTTYCRADVEVYQLRDDDRTLQFSTLCFDIAIEEIFPPLISGGAIVVRPSERADSANELSAIIDRYSVTAIHLATAYWHEWVDLMVASADRAPESLRLVIATGEKVSTAHYRRWIDLCDQDVLWCNAYGPTEATVTATVFVPDRDFDREPMPIGKPLPGYSAWILDAEMRPIDVPDPCAKATPEPVDNEQGAAQEKALGISDAGISETGTLYVGGPALALGYLNRPELTEKAFVEVELPHGRERLYCTGDLARWLPDGNIEFAGRVDHQIKLGSYRIEPGEIEAGLTAHPGVLEALVLHEQVGAQKYLVAYVVNSDPAKLDLVDLARHVRESLPAYMVPHRYCVLPKFQKTINGKVDRKALPDPATAVVPNQDDFCPPESDTEKKLAAIWTEVLQVPRVSVDDDFFYLGGSSLLAARVIAELKKSLDVELPVRDFFAKPTLVEAAEHVELLLGGKKGSDPSRATKRQRVKPQPSFVRTPQGNQLFHVAYQPQATARHAVVVCHPWGHEYVRAYRNLQQLSIRLADKGVATHRFDYSGTGNSSGSRNDVTIETMVDDTLAMLSEILSNEDLERVTLVGVRLGATVGAHALQKFKDSRLDFIAWDPILDGREFVSQLESMHSYALTSQTRFVRRCKNADPAQLYGAPFDVQQRESFSAVAFPTSIGEIAATSVVLSQGYAENAGVHQGHLAGVAVQETNDEIYWENPEFAERAFASREIDTAIIKSVTSNP